MKSQHSLSLLALAAALCIPVQAKVAITSLTPSITSPQSLGTSIVWTAKATDSRVGPLAFQFKVGAPAHQPAMVIDFNLGTKKKGVWTSRPFTWTPTGVEGIYQIEVIIKDFKSGQTASKTAKYVAKSLVTAGMPVVVPTANPLVALFSSPSCAAGSTMSVTFKPTSSSLPATQTNTMNCHPPYTMTFEIAGMYPNTTYDLFSQTTTAGSTLNGPTVQFTTGTLPTGLALPPFKPLVGPGPNTDTNDGIILHGFIALGGATQYPQVATDLTGQVVWYYNAPSTTDILTRPLQNGTMLTIQSDTAWNSISPQNQFLRQVDLAGNIIKETNTGILQQELLAMGATDAGPCDAFASPAPIGSACLGGFHHDAIQTLPKGYTAIIGDLEKIFQPGTQGDTTGLPVDIIGDIIIVMDASWKPVWYFDTFQHDTGAPQLDITRPAVLGETCSAQQGGCPPIFLLGTGIAPLAHDWLHANSIFYSPVTTDLIFSTRHQDWVMRIDYKDGAGTGNILWRMGPGGDFQINSSDPWPWFSHQHEVAVENGGTGLMTVFDNGNTRVSPPTGPRSSTGGTPGLGSACVPNDCNSRGMVLNVDEATMQVTPTLSQDLGEYSLAMGSAQLLDDGNYFFAATFVVKSVKSTLSYAIELLPTTGTSGQQVLNLQSTESYRNWQMPSLYAPPIT